MSGRKSSLVQYHYLSNLAENMGFVFPSTNHDLASDFYNGAEGEPLIMLFNPSFGTRYDFYKLNLV